MTKINKDIAFNILEEIKKYDSIVVQRHKSPDPDALGSQMALKLFIELNFPLKTVYAHGNEKIENYLPIPMFSYVNSSIEEESLILVTDTANYARINGHNSKGAKKLIKIDHHEDVLNEQFGDINLVMSDYSSTCEVLYYLFKIWQEKYEYKLNSEIMCALFIGIYADTGGFTFSNTKPQTFHALEEISSYDFNYEMTVNNLKLNDLEVMKAVGYAYQNIIIKKGVGYIIFDKEFQINNNVTPQQLSQIVNFLGNIRELKVWAVFNYHENFIRVNLRSRQQYNVQKIAKMYEGGGHINASGAMIKTEEQINEVVDLLLELV